MVELHHSGEVPRAQHHDEEVLGAHRDHAPELEVGSLALHHHLIQFLENSWGFNTGFTIHAE